MRTSGGRRALVGAAVTMIVGVGAVAPAGADDRLVLEGALHEHSGYSDGWPGSMPRTYFAAGAAAGIAFMGSAEHSDNAALPYVFSSYCGSEPLACFEADKVNPADSYRKWPATLEQADAASTPDFTAFRGFEWTSDVYGHINVFFSSEVTNAKGVVNSPDLLWKWMNTPVAAGGADDGIAVFNHPGAKGSPGTPEFNWGDFGYRHDVDEKVVGLETFNDQTDYGSAGAKGDPPAEGWYARALDRGWHVGAAAGEDLGHDKADDWAGPARAKTVILATGNSRAAIKSAMLERRFYAIRRRGIRLTFTVDGKPMGTRYDAAPGTPLHVEATVTAPPAEGDDLHLDLITSGGRVLASGDESLTFDATAAADERYYYVRARRGTEGGATAPAEPIAYSSPVWTTTALAPETDPPHPDPVVDPPVPPTETTPTTPTTPPPSPGPTPAVPGKASIRIASSVRPDAKGRITVPVRCVGETKCTVKAIKLTARVDRRTRTVGSAGRTTISAGATKSVRITLTRAARTVVSRAGKLKVTVSAAGKTKTVTVRKRR